MNLFSTRKRKVFGTFATCFIAGIAALAVAAWLTDGEGNGRSKGGQLQAPTVAPGQNNTVGMLPGETGYGGFTVNNPNSVALRVTAVNTPLNPGGATSSAGVNCPASNVSVNVRTVVRGGCSVVF